MSDTPSTSYFPLFEHMSREHGLTLLDSELDAIARVVRQMDAAAKPARTPRATRAAGAAGPAEPTPWAMEMVEWFANLLDAHMRPDRARARKWALCFDALLKDGRKHEEIVAVCEWARASSLWSQHFFAPTKLRDTDKHGVKYFDKFLAGMKSAQPRTAGAGKEYTVERNDDFTE